MKKVFARGRSMHPFLREGDILWVEKVPLEEIRRGNVIVYKRDRGKRDVVHRVFRIPHTSSGRLFIAKGDNGFTIDKPVHPDQVMGKAVMRLRKGGFTPITRRKEFTSLVIASLYLKIKKMIGLFRSQLLQD